MIAMVGGSDDMRHGPIPMALALAGFEVCEAGTTDVADRVIDHHGETNCILVVDGCALGASWGGLLRRHRGMPAVVVTRCGEVMPLDPRDVNRITLESPFDAAAVAAAVREVSSRRRPAVRRGRQRSQEAG